MFEKKKCPNCKEKVKESYDFCPHCGFNVSKGSKKEDWGMLGKNDKPSIDDFMLPPGFGAIFNHLAKNLTKELSAQMKELDNELKKESKKNKTQKKGSGISISISTSANKPPEIKVSSFGETPKNPRKQEKQTELQIKNLSGEGIKRFSSLPREEPKTNIRRLSNKVVYEIEMPGVENQKDISISKLENSIEIKGVSESKSYFKLIPISLPITSYKLNKGKLILELDSED